MFLCLGHGGGIEHCYFEKGVYIYMYIYIYVLVHVLYICKYVPIPDIVAPKKMPTKMLFQDGINDMEFSGDTTC